MKDQLSICFFRNSRNTRKLNNITKEFSHCELAENLDSPCYVHITKDSSLNDFKVFVHFWEIIKKYKETSMLNCGKLLTKEQAEAVLNWIRCYCNKEYFPDERDYCCISPGLKSLHGWGCKWLHTVMRHGGFGRHYGIHWYKIGPFDGEVQFIDKQDIKDKLSEEAKIKCLQLCPVFSLQIANKYVDDLPDQINPMLDDNWEYDVSAEPEEDNKRIGVRPKRPTIFDNLFLDA